MSRKTREELIRLCFWTVVVMSVGLIIKLLCVVIPGSKSDVVLASDLSAKKELISVDVRLEEDSVETDTEKETEIETKAETETETEAEVAMETETETEVETQSEVESEAEKLPEVPNETESETEELSEMSNEIESEKRLSDYAYDEDQAVALAQLMWAEARGCSEREQSLIAWTVLNRIDARYDGKSDFWSILTAPYQFAYNCNNPFYQYQYRIAVDILRRYAAEKDGLVDSGRTLPRGYLYYYGDGSHNYFSTDGYSSELWFGLGDPYEGWAQTELS